ncbi:MAG: polyprenyl synthetase family protein [Acidimicrobiia bacterium]|nr:polyprenyl synthetase family protein [Acidimicrobiia bacterium]
MPTVPGAPPPVAGEIAALVDRRMAELMAAESARWDAVAPPLGDPLAALDAFLARGGKRLRPAFCYWAYVGAGGRADGPSVVDTCAALELLHAFALVHDDVMDGSSRRRGAATVHVAFADRHAERSWRGEGRRFGEGMAVLVGDLAISYADSLLVGATRDVVEVFGELKLEMVMGQCLDLLGAARGRLERDEARQVALLKTAKYTVERPLHLGAALAGRLGELAGPLSAFGLPLGEAFQLRDDLLGAFGEVGETGKPVGEDFREGKPTVLVAIARERAQSQGDEAALAALDLVGRPDLDQAAVDRVREAAERTGARAEVESLVAELVERSCAALEAAPLESSAREALGELAHFVGGRAA